MTTQSLLGIGIAAVAMLASTACVLSESSLGSTRAGASHGENSEDGDDGATSDEGAGESDGATSDEGAGESGGGGQPATCEAADPGCFGSVVLACEGDGRWDADQDCIEAVGSCYPIGVELLAAADVIDLCAAELEEGCLNGNEPGCGQTLCECTAGGGPFDWENCWHLTSAACSDGQQSDCEAVLEACYPGTTVERYQACREVVLDEETGPGYECDCPRCGIHETCEDALAECLGA